MRIEEFNSSTIENLRENQRFFKFCRPLKRNNVCLNIYLSMRYFNDQSFTNSSHIILITFNV